VTREPSPAAFDDSAVDYDRRFTETEIGRVLRESVWRHLDAVLAPGSKILELGCGTGEDALRLARRGHRVLATDISPAMLEQAARKIDTAGVDDRVRFARLDLAAVAGEPEPPEAPFDAVFSNFGALNCIEDCSELASVLHRWLCPGGRAVFVVMGPVCLWEIAWYGLHLRPRIATRRWRDGREVAIGDKHSLRVWYPRPARLRGQLEPWFETRQTLGIGSVVPPTYAASLIRNRPVLLDRLDALDRRWAHRLSGIADHYLLSLERSDHVTG
jgi:ubiquinone/menaquinone biosynthesis C-methylase UbiE